MAAANLQPVGAQRSRQLTFRAAVFDESGGAGAPMAWAPPEGSSGARRQAR
ncbi:hypothetical protein PCAR4_830072 [Paraburkholderia caribensis]|nr:hypothetical protein PCAR4_830072 [Paraburkholderia caribensis]